MNSNRVWIRNWHLLHSLVKNIGDLSRASMFPILWSQQGKQLDKKEFQEIGSMATFKVPETQFQMFIKSRISNTWNLLRSRLLKEQSIKKEYDSWVNESQMQTTEERYYSSKALEASFGFEYRKQWDIIKRARYKHADQVMNAMLINQDIRPNMDVRAKWLSVINDY
ncbi:hypothetical protein Tco_0998049 [Tanacetum coccineum]